MEPALGPEAQAVHSVLVQGNRRQLEDEIGMTEPELEMQQAGWAFCPGTARD